MNTLFLSHLAREKIECRQLFSAFDQAKTLIHKRNARSPLPAVSQRLLLGLLRAL